jgi:hypothetical protein
MKSMEYLNLCVMKDSVTLAFAWLSPNCKRRK